MVINLYVLEVACFIHENKDLNYSNQTPHTYDTRNIQLILPKHTLQKTSHAPVVMGIKIYNLIPLELRLLPPKHSKSKLKDILIKYPMYKISEYFNSNTELFV